jgi:hypothetical protein
LWKKIPGFWLHVSESLVRQPHEITVLTVIFELVSDPVASHHELVDVVSSRFWDFENWSAVAKRSVVDDVFRVVVVGFIFDPVEHHLVEEHFFGEKIAVNYSVGKKVRGGDSDRTSEKEIRVQEH